MLLKCIIYSVETKVFLRIKINKKKKQKVIVETVFVNKPQESTRHEYVYGDSSSLLSISNQRESVRNTMKWIVPF